MPAKEGRSAFGGVSQEKILYCRSLKPQVVDVNEVAGQGFLLIGWSAASEAPATLARTPRCNPETSCPATEHAFVNIRHHRRDEHCTNTPNAALPGRCSSASETCDAQFAPHQTSEANSSPKLSQVKSNVPGEGELRILDTEFAC